MKRKALLGLAAALAIGVPIAVMSTPPATASDVHLTSAGWEADTAVVVSTGPTVPDKAPARFEPRPGMTKITSWKVRISGGPAALVFADQTGKLLRVAWDWDDPVVEVSLHTGDEPGWLWVRLGGDPNEAVMKLRSAATDIALVDVEGGYVFEVSGDSPRL